MTRRQLLSRAIAAPLGVAVGVIGVKAIQSTPVWTTIAGFDPGYRNGDVAAAVVGSIKDGCFTVHHSFHGTDWVDIARQMKAIEGGVA